MVFMKIMRMTAVTEIVTKTEANGQGHREYCKDTGNQTKYTVRDSEKGS